MSWLGLRLRFGICNVLFSCRMFFRLVMLGRLVLGVRMFMSRVLTRGSMICGLSRCTRYSKLLCVFVWKYYCR